MTKTHETGSDTGYISIYLLLGFIPLAFILERMEVDPLYVFLSSALSIIPLAKLMGESTEALAHYLGPTAGGLLNASLGNAPEIIIGYFALRQGLVDMVKASITGSIIGNLLFGLGITFLSCITKGRYRLLTYDVDSFKVHSGLLTLATFGLIIPDVFDFSTQAENEISLEISIILFLIYILSVAATFLPDEPKKDSDDALEIVRIGDPHESETPQWSRNRAALILGLVTVVLAFMSETMTGSVQPSAEKLGLTPMFIGVFVLALLGNTAELMNAVRFARGDQIELALGISLGSSTQMALMVAPTLVFIGAFHGVPMNLLFSQYELIAVILTVVSVSSFLSSGQVRPRVGVIFLALYIMLGIGFYNAPGS